MKIDALGVAMMYAGERDRLITMLESYRLQAALTKDWRMEPLDAEMLALIRPVVDAELVLRIARVEAQLAALGVEVGAAG